MNLFRHALLAAAVLAAGMSAQAAQPDRGRLLYDIFCKHCHITEIHIRLNSKVGSLADLTRYVRLWSEELQLRWTDEEIADVASFLNRTYYQLPWSNSERP